jgi:hypothetical protein
MFSIYAPIFSVTCGWSPLAGTAVLSLGNSSLFRHGLGKARAQARSTPRSGDRLCGYRDAPRADGGRGFLGAADRAALPRSFRFWREHSRWAGEYCFSARHTRARKVINGRHLHDLPRRIPVRAYRGVLDHTSRAAIVLSLLRAQCLLRHVCRIRGSGEKSDRRPEPAAVRSQPEQASCFHFRHIDAEPRQSEPQRG